MNEYQGKTADDQYHRRLGKALGMPHDVIEDFIGRVRQKGGQKFALRFFGDDLYLAVYDFAIQRAPKGYTKEHPLIINGKKYIGGQVIPNAEIAKLSPADKKKLQQPAP